MLLNLLLKVHHVMDSLDKSSNYIIMDVLTTSLHFSSRICKQRKKLLPVT